MLVYCACYVKSMLLRCCYYMIHAIPNVMLHLFLRPVPVFLRPGIYRPSRRLSNSCSNKSSGAARDERKIFVVVCRNIGDNLTRVSLCWGFEVMQLVNCPRTAGFGWWLWSLLLVLVLVAACGQIDSGEQVLAPWSPVPDPGQFALEVQPLLVASCAAAACHGRQTTFQLHRLEGSPQLPDDLNHPRQLPEPLRSDYYEVLEFCLPDTPAVSPLLLWGGGDVATHPGGQALSADDISRIVAWLEGR